MPKHNVNASMFSDTPYKLQDQPTYACTMMQATEKHDQGMAPPMPMPVASPTSDGGKMVLHGVF